MDGLVGIAEKHDFIWHIVIITVLYRYSCHIYHIACIAFIIKAATGYKASKNGMVIIPQFINFLNYRFTVHTSKIFK